MAIRIYSILLGLSLSPTALAQSTTWVSGLSTNWHAASNWSAGVPDRNRDAVIAGSVNPAISALASCRSLTVGTGRVLTINAGASLDLSGSGAATAAGAQVAGAGVLRLNASSGVLRGRFANVEVLAGTISLQAPTTLTGTLTVTGGTCSIGSGGQVGALTVGAFGAVTVPSTITSSVVVHGDLLVLADRTNVGTVANASTLPLIVRGTSHTVSGDTSGLIQFDASTTTRLVVQGAVRGVTRIFPSSSAECVVTCAGGRFEGRIESQAGYRLGEIVFDNVTCADILLSWVTARVRGTLNCEVMTLQDNVALKGGQADVLRADSVSLRSSFCYTDAPGEMRIRRGITVASTSTFRPTSSVIRFEEPLDNPHAPIVVSGADTTHLGCVILANNVHVKFLEIGGLGVLPMMDHIEIGAGCRAEVIDWHAYRVDVVAGATFDMQDTYFPMPKTLLGPTVVNGTATIDSRVSLGGTYLGVTYRGDVTIGPSGTLKARGSSPPYLDLIVRDVLTLSAGARLDLLAGAGLLLAPAGKLALNGTQTAPAVIAGTNSPMQLDGEIFARGFRISGMDVNGARIGSSARFGSPADDRNFQGGHFTGGRPGGVLLDIQRGQATTLWDLDFDNVGGATHNVRTLAGSAISIVDSRGNLEGEAFDDDPGSRINWRSNATIIAPPTARPGILRNLVSFRTRQEETLAFRLLRAPNTGLPLLPAVGPSTYNIVDDGLIAGTRYGYSVQRQRLSPFAAEWQSVFTVPTSATPHARDEGITRFVGPNGYPDIAAALIGAPVNAILFVESGTYGGFTVTRPVSIFADSPVAVLGPTLVSNIVGSTGEVVLDGLTFLPSSLLSLRDVSVPIVIRNVAVQAAPTSLYATRCPKVALQRVTATGPTLLHSSTAHAWNCAFNVVQIQGGTRFVHASTTASIQPDGTSTSVPRSGATAMLDLQPGWPSRTIQPVRIHSGGAGHFYGLLLGAGNDYFDLSSIVSLDMVLLLSINGFAVLTSGLLDGTGTAVVPLPAPDTSAVGFSAKLQLFTLDPNTLQGRLAERREAVFLR